MFLIVLVIISRNIATFCDLNKITKKGLYILALFVIFSCPRPTLDLKTEDYFK